MSTHTGERVEWWNMGSHVKDFQQHLKWWGEALEHCVGKIVIDAGCGEAFGAFLFSQVATIVHAVDNKDLAWRLAFSEKPVCLPFYDTVKFHKIDLDKEPLDITADICTAIEVIEHLENPEFFLENLKAKSMFFTVPCYGDKNEFHKRAYNEESLKQLINEHYKPQKLIYRMENKRMIGLAIK